MSLELLGAADPPPRLAAVRAIGTESARLEAEAEAIEAAQAEAARSAGGDGFMPIVMGATIGTAIGGPILGIIGSAIGFAWAAWQARAAAPMTEEEALRRLLATAAARQSPALMRARRALIAADLARLDRWAAGIENRTDEQALLGAAAARPGLDDEEYFAAAGLPRDRALAARDRIMHRADPDEEAPPALPARARLELIDGGKSDPPKGAA